MTRYRRRFWRSRPDGHPADHEFAGHDNVQLTAREMDRESNRLADAFRAMGVVDGDRVATLLDNRAEQVISFFAAIKVGAIQVPINTAYKGEFSDDDYPAGVLRPPGQRPPQHQVLVTGPGSGATNTFLVQHAAQNIFQITIRRGNTVEAMNLNTSPSTRG